MKHISKFFQNLLPFVPYFIVFIASLYFPSDPDLGWHLKYGEYFFQHGSILRDNTFSTLMPQFHWANVSWGTDVLTYAAFMSGGFLGLAIFSAVIVTLTFYFFSKAARLSLWDQVFLFPLLIYLESPVNTVSFRGQQISLLFTGILFYLLSIYKEHPKVLYLLIPFFLLWTNLHGEFLLGLGLFIIWIAFYIIHKLFIYLITVRKQFVNKNKKKNIINSPEVFQFFRVNRVEIQFLFLILLLTILVTIINPFGIGVHLDALSHFGNPLLKDIAEYLPFNFFSRTWWNQIVVAGLLLFGLLFLYFNEKLQPKIPILGMVVFLYILSFGVRRYAWPAYYLTLPLLQPLPSFLKPDRKKTVYISSWILLLFLFFSFLVQKFPVTSSYTYSWDKYCESSNTKCSPASAHFLIKHHLNKNIFTLYGWGGWLLWNYPAIKPTIDGRMHLWKDEKGYSGFDDYYSYEQNYRDINASTYNIVYMSPEKPVASRLMELVKQGNWKLIYSDNFALIFARK